MMCALDLRGEIVTPIVLKGSPPPLLGPAETEKQFGQVRRIIDPRRAGSSRSEVGAPCQASVDPAGNDCTAWAERRKAGLSVGASHPARDQAVPTSTHRPGRPSPALTGVTHRTWCGDRHVTAVTCRTSHQDRPVESVMRHPMSRAGRTTAVIRRHGVGGCWPENARHNAR
jgi:hypothetical protein